MSDQDNKTQPPVNPAPQQPAGQQTPPAQPADQADVKPAAQTQQPIDPPVTDNKKPEAKAAGAGLKSAKEKMSGKLSSILKSGSTGPKKAATPEENYKYLRPALPPELIGGEVPHIAGRETEMVWNAASQACGTERVHFCYTIADGKCWYLACPSSSMSNIPDTWCPLASALPGNSEYWDRDTVYIYEQDGSASALRWDPETGRMQVFLGASRTIMPRIQSMDASFVTINSEVAKPVPWVSRALKQEELSRQLVKWLFLTGLGVTLLALVYWFISFTMAGIFRPNLEEAKKLTQDATFNLMREASNAYRSNLTDHISRINDLSMQLSAFGGRLLKYEVTSGDSVEWTAIVPRAMEGDISRLGAVTEGIDEKQRGYLRIKGTR